ncbi:hypothetical protein YC2023_103893 [Brassica napus]
MRVPRNYMTETLKIEVHVLNTCSNKTRRRHVLVTSPRCSPTHPRVAIVHHFHRHAKSTPVSSPAIHHSHRLPPESLGSTNLPHLFRLQTSSPYQTEHFSTGNHQDKTNTTPKSDDSTLKVANHRSHSRLHRVEETTVY